MTKELDSGAYGQVLRSKGLFTLAGRPNVTGLWSQAGSVARFEPSAARDTNSPDGQELVFIGTHLHADALHAALTDCLMADGESLPPVDPFPAWHVRHRRHLRARAPRTRSRRLKTPGREANAATPPPGPACTPIRPNVLEQIRSRPVTP